MQTYVISGNDQIEILDFILQLPTIPMYMSRIMTIMTENSSGGFLVSHRKKSS